MMIDDQIVQRVAEELELSPAQVGGVMNLLSGGATIPFLARYRKDVTGNLNEAQLEAIFDRYTYHRSLEERRATILKTLSEQGVLTESLRQAIETCTDRGVLEDIFLPFRKKQRTKGMIAREKGLEPLADYLWNQQLNHLGLMGYAETFAVPERSVSSAEEAMEGACNIVAERLSYDPEIRGVVRNAMFREGIVATYPTKNAEGKKTKYEAYYSFSDAVMTIPSHRYLAAQRGVKEGILRIELKVDDGRIIDEIVERIVREKDSPFEPFLRRAVEDAYYHLIRPAIENDVFEFLKNRADEDAIKVFRVNIENVLLAAPAGQIPVIGVDVLEPRRLTVAVVDGSGTLLEHIFLRFRANDEDDGAATTEEFLSLIQRHAIQAIAIGNGPSGREVAVFFRNLLSTGGLRDVFCTFVNESALTACATSPLGQAELPNVPVPVRRAVSVARRLQDPLSELVKVEPRMIGLGQYQHDVDQKRLREGLRRAVSSCVNRVGVDLNRASATLLSYVSGVSPKIASRIVQKRGELGRFASREQLLSVEGITPSVYEQCAGFLRVKDGENPLDATAIHPEAYPVVARIAEHFKVPVPELFRNEALLADVDLRPFATGVIGELTLEDIRRELLVPSRDPRREFRVPRFRHDVCSVQDLEVGMVLEGVVTNVIDFGVFVDIGVGQDGLVHLSELSPQFVGDPHALVKVGDVVRVRVIKVDKESPRISLSMKNVHTAPPRREKPQRERRNTERVQEEKRRSRAKTAETEVASTPKDEEKRQTRRRDVAVSKRKEERPSRPAKEKPERQPAFSDSSGAFNTLLAEQLAALREKFTGK
ncbi:MAG TPA: Tex family protein [Candidatus Hydrogenedentes bacterium]|nr:Tex family protein [Candidatus Hydrogenedentota bacterium]HOL77657.1 Tex family protein [Candidatus Hydrogenedentota bacterium]